MGILGSLGPDEARDQHEVSASGDDPLTLPSPRGRGEGETVTPAEAGVQAGPPPAVEPVRSIERVVTDKGQYIAVDGKAQETFDWVSEPKLSANGKRVVYIARLGSQWLIVRNGKKKAIQGSWESIDGFVMSPDGNFLLASANGGKFVLVNEKTSIEGTLQQTAWSANGRHMAAIVMQGDRFLVLRQDGSVWAQSHSPIDSIQISPNGLHLVYRLVQKDGQSALVMNGAVITEPLDQIWAITFSPDSRRMAYAGRKDGKAFVVLDGMVVDYQGHFEDVKDIAFSKNGKNLSFAALKEGAWHEIRINVVTGSKFEGGRQSLKVSAKGHPP